MNKRLRKKMHTHYVSHIRSTDECCSPMRSQRKPRGKFKSMIDFSKHVRRHWFDPPKFNRLRDYFAEWTLSELNIYNARGERTIATYLLYKSDGSKATSEDIYHYLKVMGFPKTIVPYELGRLMISLSIINEGEQENHYF